MNIFFGDEQNRRSFPKLVSGGSYVSSIKTASDNNNASKNKNNKNENDIADSDNNRSGLKRI